MWNSRNFVHIHVDNMEHLGLTKLAQLKSNLRVTVFVDIAKKYPAFLAANLHIGTEIRPVLTCPHVFRPGFRLHFISEGIAKAQGSLLVLLSVKY